jgi:acyl-homoserine lactone acylase PvdQ
MSNEGLNAYGAVTWGNFLYQGFNENCGWMHTSTNVDVAMYAEKLLLKMTNYSMNTIRNYYLSLKN